MVDESELREVLIDLAELNKKLYEAVIRAFNEIGAIRETVRALDPTFADVLSEKREYYQGATDRLSLEIASECEAIVQKLKDGRIC